MYLDCHSSHRRINPIRIFQYVYFTLKTKTHILSADVYDNEEAFHTV